MKIPGLYNISFTIESRESVAIVGSNGSGKSTLLRLLNGLIFPTSGIFSVNNIRITEAYLKDPVHRKAFHKQIGFVFQNPDTQLFCPSVYEEIAFGPTQLNLTDMELKDRVGDCLMLLGIEHLCDRTPYTLSRGEKKKVAIAG
ncbi:MAG TPA: ABC transporter ATP-binding protein [Spirochaetia bacterium]|nr:ABC transporter ATP-binding protein [Spirochaetales bacterium]HRS65342.1 ABC transporter ATP-binding protein [Spirochaetia bacterium]HPD79605.1 ABC transporter ATP-binding protein [Spirochaetales bacterium]HQG40922.1 ABC transporter ATP-binding protein [Spirochaetales bacterium]HQK33917.1 ABC transporter ATP-binding protein [Spirochaetales bacterium]